MQTVVNMCSKMSPDHFSWVEEVLPDLKEFLRERGCYDGEIKIEENVLACFVGLLECWNGDEECIEAICSGLPKILIDLIGSRESKKRYLSSPPYPTLQFFFCMLTFTTC